MASKVMRMSRIMAGDDYPQPGAMRMSSRLDDEAEELASAAGAPSAPARSKKEKKQKKAKAGNDGVEELTSAGALSSPPAGRKSKKPKKEKKAKEDKFVASNPMAQPSPPRGRPNSSTSALNFSNGEVDPNAATQAVVAVVLKCMGVCVLSGCILVGVGHHYSAEVSGARIGDGFTYCGAVICATGLVGLLGAWRRQLWLMVLTEMVLLVLFCVLYASTIIAVLLATETHNPVAQAVDKKWDAGLRETTLENDHNRYCEKHTGNLGACYTFYEDAIAAAKRRGGTCNQTVTHMALDCDIGHGSPCFVSRTQCLACDDLCRKTYQQHISSTLKPACEISYFILGFAVVAGGTMTFLVSTPPSGLSGIVSRIGVLINGVTGILGFVGTFFFALELGEEAADYVTGTLWIMLILAVFVMGVAGGAALSIVQGKRDLMRITNMLYILLSILIMYAAIFLSVTAGTISDIDTYYRDHWDHIRAELDTVNYCDIKLDSRSGTTASGSWGDSPTEDNDPRHDPCIEQVKADTADKASVVAAVSTCVLAFILIALYFNQQAMKRIAHLLADDDVLGDRIAKAKVEVTFSKKEIEREAADLEGQLTALRAS